MTTPTAIDLVMFDLDGTLIDSLDDLASATNHMLTTLGRAPATLAQVRSFVGQGARQLVARAMPDAAAAEIEQGLALFLTYNSEHIVEQTRLYPGARETLAALRAAGFTLAVVSNKNTALCRTVLKALAAEEFFTCVVGADSFAERKPAPEPLCKVIAMCGTTAGWSIIIGDSINDIAAGQAAGVVTVGCTFGYGGLAELADADFRVDSLAELLQLPIFAGRFQ
jgi:phosphoglycolate phosphatase